MKKHNHICIIKLMIISICLLSLTSCYHTRPNYQGEIVWEKTFGGEENDQGYCIIETHDGGYAITGSTESKGNGKKDSWVLRLDKNGELIWEKTFGGDENDQGNSIIETSDDGYAITGSTESKGNGKQDLWVLKLDRDGELQWEKTFGGEENDQGKIILQKDNKHFIVAGWTESHGIIFADYWLLEIDQTGQLIWDKTYGGDDIDKINALTIDRDNNLLALGITWSMGTGGKDAWVVKLDPEGNLVWEKLLGGNQDDELYQIISDKDDYFLIGYSYSKGAGGKDAWLVKLDDNGDLQWEKFYGGRDSEFAESLVVLNNKNIVFCGQKIRYCPKCSSGGYSYYWVAHLDDELEIKWEKVFLESANSHPRKIIATQSNHLLLVGDTINNSHGKIDISIVKMK